MFKIPEGSVDKIFISVQNISLSQAFPKASSAIANSGNKGNFLAMFTREDSRSINLANMFTANYVKVS